jgi:hypothetical protein
VIHPGGSSIRRTVMVDPITDHATYHYTVKVYPSGQLSALHMTTSTASLIQAGPGDL